MGKGSAFRISNKLHTKYMPYPLRTQIRYAEYLYLTASTSSTTGP